MDLTYIHAVAAFSGSASGTVATVLTGLFTQRRKDRALRRSQAMSQRQDLYKSFVEEASRLHADALINEASDTSKLVNLYALIGRMRILSSDEVIKAAEEVGHLIIETYLAPNKTFVELPELLEGVDPLRRFSEAWRVAGNCKQLTAAEESLPCRYASTLCGWEVSFSQDCLSLSGAFRLPSMRRGLKFFRKRGSTCGSVRITNGRKKWCSTPCVRD